LIVTTTVLADIKTAPAAGLNNIPSLYSTPAAKGNAIILYPVAQMLDIISYLVDCGRATPSLRPPNS